MSSYRRNHSAYCPCYFCRRDRTAAPYLLSSHERLNSIQANVDARQAMWERHQELLREYPDILRRDGGIQ